MDRALWGKLGQGHAGAHPVIAHVIDVAAVASEIWTSVLPGSSRRIMANGLGLGIDDAAIWIPVLAGLHDIGKVSLQFQLGTLPDPGGHHVRWLRGSGLSTRQVRVPLHHGVIGQSALADLLEEHGLRRREALALADLLGGHHGEIRDSDTVAKASFTLRDPDWCQARRTLISRVIDLLVPQGTPVPTDVSRPAGMLLAGLTSVADWIGSDADHFPYLMSQDEVEGPVDRADLDLPVVLASSRAKARQVLVDLGWGGWRPGHERVTFKQAFDRQPRPLQKAVDGLADASVASLAVIEAPMGEGKTEAALRLADLWANSLEQRGLYFALPTQATSNQMLGRVRDALMRRYPDDEIELQLLHGHKSLDPTYQALQAASLDADAEVLLDARDDEPGIGGNVAASEWFARRKHGMLASHGVGTIDQLLLSGMRVKHVFVRLFGVAGKVVIIDEVHAYDPYMTDILERAIEWLGALGSCVVILSATLPDRRRRSLQTAYVRGAGGLEVSPENLPYAAHPRISVASASGETTVAHVAPDPAAGRTLAVRRISDPSSEPTLIDEIIAIARSGGHVAVVANTVGRAQSLYRSFHAACNDDDRFVLDVFHARFPLEQRLARERQVIERYGHEGRDHRADHGSILFATQIIEQSLDIDFDLMVTEFAPIDLLLQRSGRVHRHRMNDAQRPAQVRDPALWVIEPDIKDGVPVFERGTAMVYRDMVSMLGSWFVVRELDEIQVPGDMERLVEAGIGQDSAPVGLTDDEEAAWARALEGRAKRRDYEEGKSTSVRIASPVGRGRPDFAGMLQFLGDDEAASTRLDMNQQMVILTSLHEGEHFIDGHRIDLSSAKLPTTVARLVAHSLSLRQGTLGENADLPAPKAFAASPILRSARLLGLDEEQQATVGSLSRPKVAHFDAVAGLTIVPALPAPEDVPDSRT